MRLKVIKDSNNFKFEGIEEKARREFKLRQPTLSWPAKRDEERKEDGRRGEEEVRVEDKETYVKGSSDEDKKKYRKFLEYC